MLTPEISTVDKEFCKDYQKPMLQLLIVKEEIVTASEPNRNFIINFVVCCELGSELLTPNLIAQHETYISWTVNIKVKYTPTRMDLSREHVVFKLSCMVVNCAGAQHLQLDTTITICV